MFVLAVVACGGPAPAADRARVAPQVERAAAPCEEDPDAPVPFGGVGREGVQGELYRMQGAALPPQRAWAPGVSRTLASPDGSPAVRFPLAHLEPSAVRDSERWAWPEGVLELERRAVEARCTYSVELPHLRFTDQRGRSLFLRNVDLEHIDTRTLHVADFDGDGAFELYFASMGDPNWFWGIADGATISMSGSGNADVCVTGWYDPTLPPEVLDRVQRAWAARQETSRGDHVSHVEWEAPLDVDGDGQPERVWIERYGHRTDLSEVQRDVFVADGARQWPIARGSTSDHGWEECDSVRLAPFGSPAEEHLWRLNGRCFWNDEGVDPRCSSDPWADRVRELLSAPPLEP